MMCPTPPPPPPPPFPVSSTYHGWVMWGCDYQSSLIRGRNPMLYAIMDKGYPLVTPSLI